VCDPSTRVERVNQPPSDPSQRERARLRRHRRERQILVFGLIIVAMATAGLYFASVYKGETTGPFSAPFVTPASEFESDVNVACAPNDTLPMLPTEVAIRILNGTDKTGLAGAAADDLEGRGFVITNVGNWSRSYGETIRIMYGESGLVQAYTLATYFTTTEMILDTRENTVVDVVLGEKYAAETLRGQLAPELEADAPLTASVQCLPVSLIAPEPAPRIIPDDPFATASPSPSASASSDGE